MLSNLKPVLSFSSSSWRQEFDIIVQGGVYMFHASAAYQSVPCIVSVSDQEQSCIKQQEQ